MTTKDLIKELLNYPMNMEIDDKVKHILDDSKAFPLCKSCNYFDRTKMNEQGIGYCKLHGKEIDKYNSCEYHVRRSILR